MARSAAERGHDMPEQIVRRGFDRSHANLPAYTAQADRCRIYEDSGSRPA